MKILIIEDEYSLADAIAETLQKEKFQVNIVTNGEDGENEALTNIYDLILLDVMLPKKDGFEINGGTVIALGSDMLEKPENSSKQKSVCFSLNSKIFNGTKISLKNELDEEIISFEAKEDFRTLIISNSKLTSGTYYLYENGEKTDYIAEV